jgi:hypothetical protein
MSTANRMKLRAGSSPSERPRLVEWPGRAARAIDAAVARAGLES